MSFTILTLFLFAVLCNCSKINDNIFTLNQQQQEYVVKLFSEIGPNNTVTVETLQKSFNKEVGTWITSIQSDCVSPDRVVNVTCLVKGCLSLDDLTTLTSQLNPTLTPDLVNALPLLLHLLNNTSCDNKLSLETAQKHHPPPSSLEVWGYGILCTTVINLCALGGMVALPFIHGSLYKKMLIYMVGLAVGTLTGSSLLFLIPEALELTEQELNQHSYIWKCLTVIFGLYTFFIIERLLKLIMERKEARKYKKIGKRHNKDTAMDFSSFHQSPPALAYKNVDTLPHVSPCGENDSSNSSLSEIDTDIQMTDGLDAVEGTSEKNTRNEANGVLVQHKKHHQSHAAPVEPVAWMIIFGDGLHNFIDGVSIGAAFTESILAGLSVSIAILCEELPHELGDFAVLLNAGMKIKKALLYNFLSATMCYLGLVLGIVLGENTTTHAWVFAFAGGMFLYISLVDMMPEMNSAAESKENLISVGKGLTFFLQNLGLWTGFGAMLLMAVYGGNLEAAVRGH